MFDWLEDFRNTELGQDNKWWLIETAIKQNISEGLSQSSLRDQLRYYGFSFGNSEYSQRYQALRDFGEKFEYFGKLPENRIANPESIAQVDWIKANYRYVGDYYLTDADTGKQTRYTTAINSDDLFTPRQALQELIKQGKEKYNLPPEALASLSIIGALYNPDYEEE